MNSVVTEGGRCAEKLITPVADSPGCSSGILGARGSWGSEQLSHEEQAREDQTWSGIFFSEKFA